MIIVFHTVFVFAAMAALFWLPAHLAARLFLRRQAASAIESHAAAAGFAAFVVPTIYFFAGAIPSYPLQLGLIVAVALPLTAILAICVSRIGRSPKRLEMVSPARTLRASPASSAAAAPPPERDRTETLLALMAAGLSFGFQILFFDTIEEFNTLCTYAPIALATAESGSAPAGAVLFWTNHQRMGVTAVLAPTAALFGVAGVRLAWGLIFAALSLAVFVLVRRLGGARMTAFAGGALAGLLPALAFDADQNRLVLGLTAFTVLLFTLRPHRSWALGWLLALTLGAEPTLVVAAPAFVLATLGHPAVPWRRVGYWGRLAGGFALMGLPFLLRYAFAFESFVFHENFSYVTPQLYSLFGWSFETRAFFGWPLHDGLVRSPFNPLPNVALLPVVVQSHFGALLTSAIALGFVAVARRRGLFVSGALALFFLCVAGFLALNENWTQKDKWAIVTIAYLPLLLTAPLGGQWLLRRDRRLPQRLLLFALVVGGAGGGRMWLAGIDAPEDVRNRRFIEHELSTPPLPQEPANYLALERAWTRRFGWLPEGRPWLRMGIDWAARVRALGDELRHLSLSRRSLAVLDASAHWMLGDPYMASGGWPRALFERVATGPDIGAPERVRIDLSVAPDFGLDISTATTHRTAGCGDESAVLRLFPFDSARKLMVPWNEGPVVVSLGESEARRVAVLWLGRGTAHVLGNRLSKMPSSESNCISLHYTGERELLVFDVVSADPVRIYVYSVTEDKGRLTMSLKEY